MTELFELGKRAMKEQTFSGLLGAELISIIPGEVELGLDIRDDLKQQHGFVHGGVVSYLADNALTFAGGSVMGNCVTLEFKINYLRPAIGNQLKAKASVLSSGKNQAVCECRVFAASEQGENLVAVAQGTVSRMD